MRHRFVNHARNVWDRAVSLLPRIDQLWYKYVHMEEMLGNVAGARQARTFWEVPSVCWGLMSETTFGVRGVGKGVAFGAVRARPSLPPNRASPHPCHAQDTHAHTDTRTPTHPHHNPRSLTAGWALSPTTRGGWPTSSLSCATRRWSARAQCLSDTSRSCPRWVGPWGRGGRGFVAPLVGVCLVRTLTGP